ncbi:hypothetical protein ADUPG1_000359, partial [Aduncisulcus paluster]
PKKPVSKPTPSSNVSQAPIYSVIPTESLLNSTQHELFNHSLEQLRSQQIEQEDRLGRQQIRNDEFVKERERILQRQDLRRKKAEEAIAKRKAEYMRQFKPKHVTHLTEEERRRARSKLGVWRRENEQEEKKKEQIKLREEEEKRLEDENLKRRQKENETRKLFIMSKNASSLAQISHSMLSALDDLSTSLHASITYSEDRAARLGVDLKYAEAKAMNGVPLTSTGIATSTPSLASGLYGSSVASPSLVSSMYKSNPHEKLRDMTEEEKDAMRKETEKRREEARKMTGDTQPYTLVHSYTPNIRSSAITSKEKRIIEKKKKQEEDKIGEKISQVSEERLVMEFIKAKKKLGAVAPLIKSISTVCTDADNLTNELVLCLKLKEAHDYLQKRKEGDKISYLGLKKKIAEEMGQLEDVKWDYERRKAEIVVKKSEAASHSSSSRATHHPVSLKQLRENLEKVREKVDNDKKLISKFTVPAPLPPSHSVYSAMHDAEVFMRMPEKGVSMIHNPRSDVCEYVATLWESFNSKYPNLMESLSKTPKEFSEHVMNNLANLESSASHVIDAIRKEKVDFRDKGEEREWKKWKENAQKEWGSGVPSIISSSLTTKPKPSPTSFSTPQASSKEPVEESPIPKTPEKGEREEEIEEEEVRKEEEEELEEKEEKDEEDKKDEKEEE